MNATLVTKIKLTVALFIAVGVLMSCAPATNKPAPGYVYAKVK